MDEVGSASNCVRAGERLVQLVENDLDSASRLTAGLEEAIPVGFTVFRAPETHRRRLRTSRASEDLNLPNKRRTRVARLFPDEAPVLWLVTAILMENSEEW